MANTRTKSRAAEIGDGGTWAGPAIASDFSVHPTLKAKLGGSYIPGSLVTALAQMRSRDAEEQAVGKAALGSIGVQWADAPLEESAKATLGTTGATGGYVLPNNVVDTVEKPPIGAINWLAELTVRDGVNVRGVDQPFRPGAPTRMTTQSWGETKTNINRRMAATQPRSSPSRPSTTSPSSTSGSALELRSRT
jgi:hypothetical protein